MAPPKYNGTNSTQESDSGISFCSQDFKESSLHIDLSECIGNADNSSISSEFVNKQENDYLDQLASGALSHPSLSDKENAEILEQLNHIGTLSFVDDADLGVKEDQPIVIDDDCYIESVSEDVIIIE